MNLGWDSSMAQVVVEAFALDDSDIENEPAQQEPTSNEMLRGGCRSVWPVLLPNGPMK